MLLFIHAVFFLQIKSRHFTRGSQTIEIYTVRQLLLLRQKRQILKMTLPQKKRPYRTQTPSSKWMILVSSCWNIFYIRNNGHSLFILSLVFWNHWSYGLHSFWATLYNVNIQLHDLPKGTGEGCARCIIILFPRHRKSVFKFNAKLFPIFLLFWSLR